MMRARRLMTMLVAIGAVAGCARVADQGAVAPPVADRPNVVVIMADDMGYSDLGAFGGEIATPNLDALAARGVRLTHFHSAPSCSPTRAMMLSGADSHIAGLGAMAEYVPPHYRGQAGFEGTLSRRVATLAERFAAAGYRTAMAGKWHLGMADGQRPAQRGFQSSFALLQGAANHFGQGGFGTDDGGLGGATYLAEDRPVTPDRVFYSSDMFTRQLIGRLDKGDRKQPFFAYLAFTAPHSPLQAPAADIARYADTYRQGWAVLAQQRLRRMEQAGVLPGKLPYDRDRFGPSQQDWDALTPEQQVREARRMAIYAAMVDRMDQNVGRLVAALKRTGQFDNTIFVFLSDNGPAGEDPRHYMVMPGFKERYQGADQSVAAMGSASSFVLQDPRWASAIAAPSRLFKGFVTEGGTLVPAIISYRGLPKGTTNPVIGDVRDLTPTVLGMAGLPVTEQVNGMAVAVVEGANLTPWLSSGQADRPIEHVAFGFNGQAVVRAGPWKAMRLLPPVGDGQWRLFNTLEDPAERVDRQTDQPALFRAMQASWQGYVTRHGLDERADVPVAPTR